MANEKLANELKGLASEVSKAMGKMKKSPEFKKLKKDLATGLKSVAASVAEALKAAQTSPSAGRIKNRLKRVVKTGKTEGMAQAQKAEVLAARKIKQASKALKEFTRKIKS